MSDGARLDPQTWMTAPETSAVLVALRGEGETTRFVGGCVRDAVLRRPVEDVDLATSHPPETVMSLLAAAGLRAIPTGIAHGTVTALSGGRRYEITTLRHDVETYGRHARVAFTDDWRADAARRDFTMNAISCDPDGTLHDYFDGLADLAAGIVRFVGEPEARIREDVLRILRFFRFHARYGRGQPDPSALAACAQLSVLVPNLSKERVSAELKKILKEPVAALRTLARAAQRRLVVEFPTPADPKFAKGLLPGVSAALSRLPLIGVSSLADNDQTFLFTKLAFERVLTEHEALVSKITFLPSPKKEKGRVIAICEK
jgi:poly(A) polymerase